MAKIRILGEAIVVTSSLKLEDIKTVKKYSPNDLVILKDKEPVFALGTNSEGISDMGISFCKADKDGFATMTIVKRDQPDLKKFFLDEFGGAIAHLNALEEKLPASIEAINDARDAVEAQIVGEAE